MEMRAKSNIIEWDAKSHSMLIINKGETGNVPEHMLDLVADRLEQDEANPAPADSDGIDAARAEYKEVFGKHYFPGWDEAELRRRIAAEKARLAGEEASESNEDAEATDDDSEDGTEEAAADDAPIE